MIVERNFIQLAACSILAGAACAFTGCDRNLAESHELDGETVPAARAVQVHRVAETGKDLVVKTDGSLAAWDQAVLSAKVSGRLLTISVDLGTAVRKGELLAQIDPRDYQLRVQQAEALLAQARVRLGLPLAGSDDRVEVEKTSSVRQTKAQLEEARGNRERLLRLSEQGIAPQSEMESAEAMYQVALSRYEDAIQDIGLRQALVAQRRAELEIARQQLADTSIYAPFDGVIQERRASIGEFVGTSAPVATLVMMDPLRMRLDVAEVDAPRVRAGQPVALRVEGSSNRYTGEIRRLSPVIGEGTRMLRVEADVTNTGRLRPGSYVKAEIVVGNNPRAILIPKAAVVVFAGMEKVFVVEEGKAVERPVRTGRSDSETVEVLSGLQAGNVVVLSPGNLQTGQPVTVMN